MDIVVVDIGPRENAYGPRPRPSVPRFNLSACRTRILPPRSAKVGYSRMYNSYRARCARHYRAAPFVVRAYSTVPAQSSGRGSDTFQCDVQTRVDVRVSRHRVRVEFRLFFLPSLQRTREHYISHHVMYNSRRKGHKINNVMTAADRARGRN